MMVAICNIRHHIWNHAENLSVIESESLDCYTQLNPRGFFCFDSKGCIVVCQPIARCPDCTVIDPVRRIYEHE